MGDTLSALLMPVAAIVALGIVFLIVRLLGLWFRARMSGAPVSLACIVGMALKRVNPRAVVDAYAIAKTAGVDAPLEDIESHAMMGGRLHRTVVACAAAKKADVEFPFAMARAMDLTGRDAMETVQDLIRAKREGDRDAANSVDADAARGMIGKRGEVTVAVAPPGIVMVDGVRVNAMCATGYIKKSAKVRIVSAKDNMVIVDPVVETCERTD
ncbi:MAG: flotillin-like FloA family protein [Candidatus Hydrogenedentes bacterium]|nr:flotillin-like FloA family protein [Candidatus Hydrogenedentota bacterium]